MGLRERLDKKIRQLDRHVKRSLNHDYDFEVADMRDLLEEIRARWDPPSLLVLSNFDLYEQDRARVGYSVYRE